MYENMYRHTGILNNTGKNVVVVFMQLPEDKNHALVVDTDALPDMYNESLRRIVESTEAQQAKNLADVLGRRMSPDGSGQTMLQKFFAAQKLLKTPISNVTMVPRRGVRWPLAEVIAAMESQETLPQGFDELDPETKAEVAANLKRFNMHENNMNNETSSNTIQQAQALLEMAKLLDADAQAKREQAYRLDPNLRPSMKKTTTTESALSIDDLSIELIQDLSAALTEDSAAPQKAKPRKKQS